MVTPWILSCLRTSLLTSQLAQFLSSIEAPVSQIAGKGSEYKAGQGPPFGDVD